MLLNINTKTHYTEKKRTSRLQDFGLDERALQNILFKSLDRLFPDDELILRLSPPILVKIDLIMPKTQYSKNENLNKEDEIAVIKNKTTTPSVADWIKDIPELSKKSSLKSWKAVCDYLKIDVGGDSARRALKRWVEENKPNWPEILEPGKDR
ncbi:MAG: hypothetical protein A3J73_01180 [Planctomycetes bacterium RIFCSPHIGHO2_02_FULL_38_41]|nr:MAG: hypothetical protein A3J73_01180 [Planctomycetes bacterium RIFCSPHIGHO2_02_FULL_38_41]OHB97518.1 MAG: hypothetical protein A2W74_06430 [Planctomycetes bacterium RIFCSPLOWO2_12_38_17]